MTALDWLFAAPIAHRGLHDRAAGRIENSASAALAAIEAGFGIECDVQRSADGEAMVFHDAHLDRLTGEAGPVADRTTSALAAIRLGETQDTIMPLDRFLALVAGRVPVTVEIKSRFDGDMRLAERTAAVVMAAAGPVAVKSFDPDVIAHLRVAGAAPGVPLGVVAEAAYDHPEWADLSAELKRALGQFLHYDRSRPDFVSYHVRDLPHAVPFLCRKGLGLPVMTWTVRTPEQAALGRAWADQIVFEGFDPKD